MPKGDFLAVRDKVTLTLTGAIMGQSVNQTGIDNLWFARFVGPVKVTEEVVGQGLFDTSELTEVSINSDGDELASGRNPLVNEAAVGAIIDFIVSD